MTEDQPQEQQAGEKSQDLQEHVANNPFRRESFQAGNIRVVGDDEERWPDSTPFDSSEQAQLAGEVKVPASVALVFEQTAMVPGLMPAPGGQGLAMSMAQIHLAEYIARGIEPDVAIMVGEYLAEEGRRVKATMKYPDGDPALKALQSGLVVAGAGTEKAAAAALDPENIAGNGGQKQT